MACVGVPEITPDVGFKLNPVGRLKPVLIANDSCPLQLVGMPAIVGVAVRGTLTVPETLTALLPLEFQVEAMNVVDSVEQAATLSSPPPQAISISGSSTEKIILEIDI